MACAPRAGSGASDHRWAQIPERGRAQLLHRCPRFAAQDLEHALNASLTESTKAPQIGPADAHGAGPDGQRLDDVRSAPETAVDQDGHATGDGFDDVGQGIDGGPTPVLGAAAVIGDDDTIDANLGCELGVLRSEDALEHDLRGNAVAQPLDVVPGEIGSSGAGGALKVDAFEVRLATEIGIDAVAAPALARIGPAQAHEGLPLLWPKVVDREDDHRTSGSLRALDQLDPQSPTRASGKAGTRSGRRALRSPLRPTRWRRWRELADGCPSAPRGRRSILHPGERHDCCRSAR